MDIKSTILERKLRKTATTSGEFYIASELVKVAKDLVVALHENKVSEGEQKLQQTTIELAEKLKQLASQIQENTQKDTSAAVSDTKKEMNTLVQQLEQLTSVFLTNIEGKKTKIEARLSDIENNVEKYRGKKGDQGIAGRSGKDGKDGSPDTADQVVEKVNNATKKVKISAIEGLSDELRKAKRENGSKAAGGMGNTQHETYPVGVSTTSVTLNYSPANAGRAIWLHYQGQYMVYGTHYTVSGKVINLLFVPTDGTYLDILYIR